VNTILKAWIDEQRCAAPAEAVAFIDDAIARRLKQEQCGRLSAQLNRERKEIAVRQAIGCLSHAAKALPRHNLTQQVIGWIRRQGPATFGLRRLPSERLVRRVLSEVLSEEAQESRRNDSFRPEVGSPGIGE
jgi:hypothetical protein